MPAGKIAPFTEAAGAGAATGGPAGAIVGGLLSGAAGLIGGGQVTPQTTTAINNPIISIGERNINLGGIIQPFTGSRANGGFGSQVSRFVSSVGEPVADLAGVTGNIFNPGPNQLPFIIGAVIVGGALFWFIKRR